MIAKYIENRVLEIANYTVKTNSDIRRSAKVFGTSRSTVHMDLSERLPKIDLRLSIQVSAILVNNKHLGQLKGGEANKKRCLEGGN